MGLFKKKCICGMKEETGKGIYEHSKWFCCEECLKAYERTMKKSEQKGCCCH